MKTACRMIVAVSAVLLIAGLVIQEEPTNAAPKKSGAKQYLANVQSGNLTFRGMGRMSFGPDGLLLIADQNPASVVAIETGDVGPVKKLEKRVDNIDELVAKRLGAKADGVRIVDLAVNPKSGRIYLSAHRKAGNQFVLLTVGSDGKISNFDLDSAKYVRVPMPDGEKSKVGQITDVEFANDRVIASGQCREEFSSKIFSIPLPLTHGKPGKIFSAKTYHVAHGKWETRAPIQSFVPYQENGKNYVVGAFSCTPIAKFPIDDIQPDAKITGTSVVELGSGNRPLDMFTYERDGVKWLVTNTDRFHHKRRPIGPSQWWGCRVRMDYMKAEDINEKAVRRIVKERKGPEGIEVIEALFGAKQVAKLSETQMVVLRDNKGKLDLEVAELP